MFYKFLQSSCATAELLDARKIQESLRYNTRKERTCNYQYQEIGPPLSSEDEVLYMIELLNNRQKLKRRNVREECKSDLQ